MYNEQSVKTNEELINNQQFKTELEEVMKGQFKSLEQLLLVLEQQHEYIVKNDVFNMESCVKKVQECSKKVAKVELKRRDLIQGQNMGKLIKKMNDKELDESFRELQMLLNEVKLQKDTNELLIKHGLSYVNKMLGVLNPDRQAKTYNSYGNMRR
ncbi:flagellar protein FlgN [Clostridium aestuarii]|uniref:Flagellar protein FlgN n=1 Tax=Clostridium aestuarii TaxID=338193 RepID=A0ABT4CXF0_9CLOT|nr:flagellar protein FlgN [Clostridium aestuarii]MCY6483654.1 flagellar protein FlgN [Clostridium aestuarii]